MSLYVYLLGLMVVLTHVLLGLIPALCVVSELAVG